jgi:hypothetical protein
MHCTLSCKLLRGILLLIVLAPLPLGAQALNDTIDRRDRGSAQPKIPKTWDDAVMANLELPLAEPSVSPKHVSTEYYYRIPVRPIYQSYPVYHPNHEPSGYLDELRRKDPVLLWDDKGQRPKLDTDEDWIAAGELVFDSTLFIGDGRITMLMLADPATPAIPFVRDPHWYQESGIPITREGVNPFYRYVVRAPGNVEVGMFACAMCHTRVMADGTVLKGAQGNLPFDRVLALEYRNDHVVPEMARLLERSLFTADWVQPDPLAHLDQMTLDKIAAQHGAIPAGVIARHRASVLSPVQVPDLIGIKERPYLDRTGLQRHRDIGDLMRYSALNQGGDDLSSFGGFIPAGINFKSLPPPETISVGRFSDEQLYALALYLYSLKPPPNPHAFDTVTALGQEVFAREDCARCHDPERAYATHVLVPVPGFEVPADHPEKEHILDETVDTDPTLTLTTRRGTGFYKVPSLRGVWYRGPFEHNGSCATLEDWFDPHRLNDDYVPTGWKGPPGTKIRAVKGHVFGLDLSQDERKALIAFLKTL